MKRDALLKNIIVVIAVLSVSSGVYSHNCFAQESQNLIPIDYKQQSLTAINSNIDSYEVALKQNSSDQAVRINLAAAYIDRGNYNFNRSINLSGAANDYRKAIYYLKYDENSPVEGLLGQNLNIAVSNLKQVLTRQKIVTDPKSRLKVAKSLRGQGNFREAVVEFNEALANDSSKVESYEALGDIMRLLGKNDRSVEYFTNAIALDSQNSTLHLKLARALTNTDNLDSAVKEYNLALEYGENNAEIIPALENIWTSKIQENPQDAVAHMNLGVVLQKKGDFNGALAQYKASELIDPTSVNLRLNLGTLFQAQGNLDMAIKAYDSILQTYPNHAMTHFYRGTALRQLGNNKDAVTEFLTVLNLDPKYTPARKAIFDTAKKSSNADERLAILNDFARLNPSDALAQYNLAFEFHSKKQTDNALAYYQKAISIDPKLVDAYLNIASIYKEKSQYAEATATLQNALKVNPDDKKLKKMIAEINDDSTSAVYQQALDKYNKQDYAGAIQDYQKIIASGNTSPDVYLNLGSAYQAANKYDEAINSYSKALAVDEKNADALFYMGTAYYSKQNYGKALEYYQKALTINPDNKELISSINDAKVANAQIKLEKGLKEYNSKNYTKALQLFNDVIKTDPGNGYAYYYRGMVYDAFKNYKLAIEDYLKAVDKSQDLNVAYYSLAIDYDMLQNKALAKNAYEKFIKSSKNPNDEYVKYAKQRVKSL